MISALLKTMDKTRLHAACKAGAVHLGISASLAALAATLVLGVWYPFPFYSLAGGDRLLGLTAGVIVVCGPLLSAILYNPYKSRRALLLDLSLVALLQLGALSYGLHSMALARPVVLAFETDRFVAVSAAQIDPAQLPQAPPDLRHLSWRGPRLIGTRTPKDNREMLASIDQSLQGVEPSARPGWWQAYEKSETEVQARMKKLSDLRAQCPVEARAVIDAAAHSINLALDRLYYLPLTSQKILDGWIVLLNDQAKIVGYTSVDGF
ncbi:MAG: hypothetical protein P9E24_05205 [Candidatus Competibacter sp.]|nr:hypothetical protein [Candidatus Competibacter sp.]MDG4584041.1 hypothetical protein [Candidatus Competibacter sp.]